TGYVSARIVNLGHGAIARAFEVVFFEDLDGNGLYEKGKDNDLARTTVSETLLPLAEINLTVAVSGSTSFPGETIGALVDARGEVAEENESNNVLIDGKNCLSAPDLAPSFVRVTETSDIVFL